MQNNKIQSTIEYWKERLSATYGKDHILSITLYGSQNYNIDTPNSDVDVKAIYVPSITEAIINKNWMSKELHDKNNQHCEIKDIREMCKMYSKQNINFLETLFTRYRWDNPLYNRTHILLNVNRENISKCQPYYAIKSICGQGINTIKQLKNNPTDGKKMAKAIYFYLFLNKYKENYPYEKCLKIDEQETFLHYNARNLLIDLKLNNYDFDYCNSLIIKMIENSFKSNLKNVIDEKPDNITLRTLKRTIPLSAINDYENNKSIF